MLQETMTLLWEKMPHRLLTESAYRSLTPQGPGIAAALALRGQAAMSALTDPQRDIARRIVLRLINFGEGRADTRRQLPEGDLCSNGDNPTDFKAARERLGAKPDSDAYRRRNFDSSCRLGPRMFDPGLAGVEGLGRADTKAPRSDRRRLVAWQNGLEVGLPAPEKAAGWTGLN